MSVLQTPKRQSSSTLHAHLLALPLQTPLRQWSPTTHPSGMKAAVCDATKEGGNFDSIWPEMFSYSFPWLKRLCYLLTLRLGEVEWDGQDQGNDEEGLVHSVGDGIGRLRDWSASGFIGYLLTEDISIKFMFGKHTSNMCSKPTISLLELRLHHETLKIRVSSHIFMASSRNWNWSRMSSKLTICRILYF